MSTVGMGVGEGAGSAGWGPVDAASGTLATWEHAETIQEIAAAQAA
jgi:hypothetical protein